MPEMGGMETAYKLKQLKEPPLFAFITQKKDMAVEAFELGALDYMVKPIEQSRVEKTIERAKARIIHRDVIEEIVNSKLKERIDFILERYKKYETYSDRLPVREKGKVSLLNQADIIYCESQGKKVSICTCNGDYKSTYTLNELESRLNDISFFRAHQAFIVNLNYVKEIVSFGEGSYLLHLNGSSKNIILSRSRSRLLKEKMGI